MEVSYLQIEPTTRCNFTCGFCVGRHMAQKNMKIETFRKSVESITNLKHISIQGEGEPLLHREFSEMLRIVRSRHPKAKISFISNGSFFTKKNIDLILSNNISRIMISIESADEDAFFEIRGGKLAKVKAGIRALLEERNKRNLSTPVLGFAVTIMKRTLHSYKDILKLYKELKMDGGFTLQTLQNMEIYTRYYDEKMMQQVLSPEDLEAFNSNVGNDLDLLEVLANSNKQHPTYYNDLFSSTEVGCPWLANGLYVNVDGMSTGCCYMKESSKYGFGVVDNTSISSILEHRENLQNQLLQGTIPEACAGCEVAISQVKKHSEAS